MTGQADGILIPRLRKAATLAATYMNIRLTLIFSFFLLLLLNNTYAQTKASKTIFSFKRELEKLQPSFYWQETPNGFVKMPNRHGLIEMEESDTLTIEFGNGFDNDNITIKCSDTVFKANELNTLWNHVGEDTFYMKPKISNSLDETLENTLRIPKAHLKNTIIVYFNNQKLKVFQVDRKYSFVRLEYYRKSNQFVWRYYKYGIMYL